MKKKYLPLMFKTIVVHSLTYSIVGGLYYQLVTHRYYVGETAVVDWLMRDPNSLWVQSLWLPAQVLRGILISIILYAIYDRIVELKNKGWMLISGLYLLVGWLSAAGPTPGSIEGIVYTKVPLDFQIISALEVIIQGLLLGLILNKWIQKTEAIQEVNLL
ncbi:MAG: hypothetical protein IBX64_05800 [Actinobacteria bacterium]|nr:hypothetical protein [Actinomycetota bacterium]